MHLDNTRKILWKNQIIPLLCIILRNITLALYTLRTAERLLKKKAYIIVAQRLLINGVNAQEACRSVGYSVYSSFYRAYQQITEHPRRRQKHSSFFEPLAPVIVPMDRICPGH